MSGKTELDLRETDHPQAVEVWRRFPNWLTVSSSPSNTLHPVDSPRAAKDLSNQSGFCIQFQLALSIAWSKKPALRPNRSDARTTGDSDGPSACHFAVCVNDLDKAAAFYQSVFDLKRIAREDLEIGSAIYMSDGVINLALLNFKGGQGSKASDL